MKLPVARGWRILRQTVTGASRSVLLTQSYGWAGLLACHALLLSGFTLRPVCYYPKKGNEMGSPGGNYH